MDSADGLCTLEFSREMSQVFACLTIFTPRTSCARAFNSQADAGLEIQRVQEDIQLGLFEPALRAPRVLMRMGSTALMRKGSIIVCIMGYLKVSYGTGVSVPLPASGVHQRPMLGR